MVKPFYELCLTAKTFQDEVVCHKTFIMYVKLLTFMGFFDEAIQLVYLLLDLSLEMMEMHRAMEYYGYLGDLYERNKDYKTAMIAFKKMLQFSWINKAVAFEIEAYFGIARQYFYMQMLEKAEYYLDRSLNGKCEEMTTGPRNLACTSIKHEKFFAS